ncbi:hypothetical protein CFK37_17970 [Virgibacillus phasianinus]|uniref:Uncharacterized protein n=1 Tax=Virgibacillus phasianinus TaxID=2017483 RepID=A0A220U6Y0_9BACI|nr:hypothetical protein [Virgibacillus phasianinus]ASK63908.1 hypothetical protein CFK37_17970 [Virgibacillus phasianinus]
MKNEGSNFMERLKSLPLMLLGTLIGITIAFVAKGMWIDKFDWGPWVSSMIGGIIAYLIILVFIIMNRKKNNNGN